MSMIARFANDESGATAIEYGLIAALISVAIIVVLTNIGADLNGVFTKIETNLKAVSG
jgi:pilus assembly protein Flp/PilA